MSFHDEMAEIMKDIDGEMVGYIEQIAPEQVQVIRNFLNETMNKHIHDPEAFLAAIQTLALMMFLAGREHALRGYAPPVPKEGFTLNVDTPEEFLRMIADLENG